VAISTPWATAKFGFAGDDLTTLQTPFRIGETISGSPRARWSDLTRSHLPAGIDGTNVSLIISTARRRSTPFGTRHRRLSGRPGRHPFLTPITCFVFREDERGCPQSALDIRFSLRMHSARLSGDYVNSWFIFSYLFAASSFVATPVNKISASAAPSPRAYRYHRAAAVASPRTPFRRAWAKNAGS
jgi:hypothetical protein